MIEKITLADFIHEQRQTIVAEWQQFAQTLLPAAEAMNGIALRDHADEILTEVVRDMRSQQTTEEQAEKSKGRGTAQRLEAIGKIHAALRIENGFKLAQLVAEYRALRASVLRLWAARTDGDANGVTRFNEAIDEALVEAVALFAKTSEHYRDQTLGILGHDLRNPLTAVIAVSTMLISDPELDRTTVRKAAGVLHSAANRMNRMISDLLDLTRTRSGDTIPVAPTAIDLEPLCRQVVAELGASLPEGRLRLTAKGNLQGQWDGDRISQVISNLVRNAIEHGASGEPIDLVAEDLGDEVGLSVRNAGRPIPLHAQLTIFDPMVRHVGNERLDAGVGLGLYIASQLVVAHRGTLRVVSTEAEGTTFTARLPRQAECMPARRTMQR
jgi:signal transduction histidine kinase